MLKKILGGIINTLFVLFVGTFLAVNFKYLFEAYEWMAFIIVVGCSVLVIAIFVTAVIVSIAITNWWEERKMRRV